MKDIPERITIARAVAWLAPSEGDALALDAVGVDAAAVQALVAQALDVAHVKAEHHPPEAAPDGTYPLYDLELVRRAEGHTPPQGARDEAARGLRLREENGGKGGTDVGVARARDISNGKALSLETIGRMVSFFARHDGNQTGDDKDEGKIAWLLWGGDAGRRWADSVWDRERGKKVKARTLTKADDGACRQVAKSEAKRVIWYVLYEPEKDDAQGERMSRDAVEEMMWRSYDCRKVRIEHGFDQGLAKVFDKDEFTLAEAAVVEHYTLDRAIKAGETFRGAVVAEDIAEGAGIEAIRYSPEVWEVVSRIEHGTSLGGTGHTEEGEQA